MKRIPAQRKNKSVSKASVNRSARRKIYRVGIVSLVFVVSLGFLFSYTFFKYLNQNFVSASSASSYSISDDKIPTVSYMVAESLDSDPIVIKKVNFIIFNKENKKVSIYDIPVDIEYSLPGKYGMEVMSKTFALGGLNSDDKYVSGAEAVSRSIFKLFGFKVDKFVLTDAEHEIFFDQLWHEGGAINLVNLKDVSGLKDSLRTDLDIKEFYDLLSFVYSLPSDRVVDEENSPTNFDDTDVFDNYIREYTYESFVAKEGKSISLLNGTGYAGLASFGSRVVQNFGGNVVATQNTINEYEKSVIISEDLDSSTVGFLSRVFKIDNVISKDQASGYKENEIDRSDVIVIFGFDTLGDLY
jgi:hypothetical protein